MSTIRTFRTTRTSRTSQRGFTMIELIVVIVILGILAATALPKFIDIKGDAQTAAVAGVAGAAGSAMNVNFSGCAVKNNVATAGKCVTVNTCAGVTNIMQGGLPTGYTVAPLSTDLNTTNGTTQTCVVTATGASPAASAAFQGVSAGN
jgi:MSHA pilin protein MshA